MRTRAIVLVLAAACSGGGGATPIDAAPPVVDAGPDAVSVDAVTAGSGGGAATVDVDLGTDPPPTRYAYAWWNHGHGSKACFAVDVVISTAATVDDGYVVDPAILEITFARPPVVGANAVQLHLHAPDRYLPGTATMAAVSATDLTGAVEGHDGALVISGDFTAVRCEAIYDPCI
jgi:hypothetical protein